MKRTKLRNRTLPDYTRGEEIMNMVTHIVGGGLGIIVLPLCLWRSIISADAYAIVSGIIYGSALICLYAMSSIYHGLLPCTGKKVLQVLDHCAIYFLIAGTYTPITLCALRPAYPLLGWGMLLFQWALAALSITLTAIDLKKYRVFSMICYIGTGWAILPFFPQAIAVLTPPGFYLLLSGGIAYSIGAILFAIGSKKHWFHSIFHIFVVLGSLLQFLCVFLYVL